MSLVCQPGAVPGVATSGIASDRVGPDVDL